MGHTYSHLLYHVVFSTKDRRRCIEASFRDRLYEYMGGIARDVFGRAISVGGTEDHVHVLLSIRPSVSVAEAVKKLKSLSSGWVNKTLPPKKPSPRFYWQSGYGAFSVSESAAPQVARYIARQAEHHRRVSFEEEFVAFLERHGVEFDPGAVWG